MTDNIIHTPRKTSLSETGSRSLTSELSVQRPEGASYGGSQTWFSSPSIRGYGCGLIAAHDLLWYLERKESLTAQTDEVIVPENSPSVIPAPGRTMSDL